MSTYPKLVLKPLNAIKNLLKEKRDHARICKFVETYNLKNLKKIKTELGVSHTRAKTVTENRGMTMDCPEWTSGRAVFHQLRTGYTPHESKVITALHVIYNKIRKTKKQHTGNDDAWIEANSYYFETVSEQLLAHLNLPSTFIKDAEAAHD